MSSSTGGSKTLALGHSPEIATRRTRPSGQRKPSALLRLDPEGPEWELVQRIAVSRRFQRSTLLTNFLLYISRQALTGNAASISEHQIGVQVFGRREQFNRSDDNIVRNYARMLRARIDEYFQSEGKDEPLRLDIPRGGYVPVFTPATPTGDAQIPASAEAEAAAVDFPARPFRDAPSAHSQRLLPAGWLVVLGLVAGFSLALTQPWNWMRVFSPTARLNHRFWNSLFSQDRDTILVPSDGGLVILHRFLEQPTTLRDYVDGSYRSTEMIASGLRLMLHNADPEGIPTLSHKVEALGDRRYTSVVDLDLTTRIAAFAQTPSNRLKIRYARDLHMDDLKSSNVVLIGSVDANPWVALFQPELNFQFTPGGSFGGSAVIINRKPLPGEAKTFASITGDPAQRTYGVIAYVPNLGGSGHVLIIEGINMAGTQAAGEFLLNADRMTEVLKRSRKPDGGIHPFEILIETASVGANSSQLRILSERISPI